MQKTLSVAAYTRSTFDLRTIDTLMEDLGYLSDSDDLRNILEDAICEQLLSYNTESKMYTFFHERIKKAACLLIPSGEQRQNLQAMVGACLWQLGLADDGEDWMLFVAADNLNGNKFVDLDLIFMVDVNVLVGRTALVMGAYAAASSYLQKGIELLKQIDCYWEERYDLSLQLFQAYATAELYRGHIDKGGVIAQIVLKNAKGLRDQLPMYLTLAVVSGQMENHAEGLQLCCNVLQHFEVYPSRLYSLGQSVWLSYYFRKKSDDDILHLQRMSEDIKIATMKFICQAIVRAHLCSKWAIIFEFAVRGISISLKYGLCGESALCLAAYALCIVTSQYEQSLRLTRLAQKILDQSHRKTVGGWTLVASASSIFPWNDNNHAQILKLFNQGYRYGMECGDIEVAILNRTCAIAHSLVLGYSLTEVDKSMRGTMEQLLFYNLKASYRVLKEYENLIVYLTDRNRPNFEDLGCFGQNVSDCSQAMRLKVGFLLRMLLGVHFGEFAFAKMMVTRMSSMGLTTKGGIYPYQMLYWSYYFFMAAGLAHQTRKSKYRIMAQKMAKQVKKFPRSHNCSSIYLIMKAELITMRDEGHSIINIQATYDKAIHALLKAGYIQYAALASSFAGEYFLRINKKDLSGKYFSQAKMCYREWGAKSLVDHLGEKLGSYVSLQTSDDFLSEYVACQP